MFNVLLRAALYQMKITSPQKQQKFRKTEQKLEQLVWN